MQFESILKSLVTDSLSFDQKLDLVKSLSFDDKLDLYFVLRFLCDSKSIASELRV